MRILQVVKTTDGAHWAVLQAAQLVQLGVEVHVAVPRSTGRQIDAWNRTGAKIHVAALDLPVKSPWKYRRVCDEARKLVALVKPDLIHSHFVGTTMLLRRALGKHHPVPRIFQVPGPLHLEHWLYRNVEINSAWHNDYWIASSRYISSLYEKSGVDPQKLFISYYGTECESFSTQRTGVLRNRLGINDDTIMVGNMNHMYPPKYYLGQRVGLKCHEDIIKSLAMAIQNDRRLVGVLVGGAWNNQVWYEQQLRRLAQSLAGDRIVMPGHLNHDEVRRGWADFDLVVHSPLSENCGGVHEAMITGVPVIAGRVGGLSELVVDGFSGTTVPARNPHLLAREIQSATCDLDSRRNMAKNGQTLVKKMFDIERTATEVRNIYRHVLNKAFPRPMPFDIDSVIGKTHAGDKIAC
ncbi:MAG: hypothetical protein JWP89_6224 [Schlesneria sp.]|nr:hypothetical protein [Schlesneria sp.]